MSEMELSVRIRVRAFENLGGPVVSRDSFTSKIPSCAAPCIDSDESQTGCSSDDDGCLCTDPNFLGDTLNCAAAMCSNEDTQTVVNTINQVCIAALNAPRHGSGAPNTDAGTTGDTTILTVTIKPPSSSVTVSSKSIATHTFSSTTLAYTGPSSSTSPDSSPQTITSSYSSTVTRSSTTALTSRPRVGDMTSPSSDSTTDSIEDTASPSSATSLLHSVPSSSAIISTIGGHNTATTSSANITSTAAAQAETPRDLIIALSSALGLFVLVASVLGYFLWTRKRRQVQDAGSGHEVVGCVLTNASVHEEGAAKDSQPRRGASVSPRDRSMMTISAYATTSLAGEPGSPRLSTSLPSSPGPAQAVSSHTIDDRAVNADITRDIRGKHTSLVLRETASSLGITLPLPSRGAPSGLDSDEVEPRDPWASDDREEEPPPYEPRRQD